MKSNTKKKKAQKGITEIYTDMAHFVNANVQNGTHPDHILKGWYNETEPYTKITDNRKTRATTGKPMRPTKDLLTKEYPTHAIVQAVLAAQKEGVDPNDMVSLFLQESELGIRNPDNPGHIDYRKHSFNTGLINPSDYSARLFRKGIEAYPQDSLKGIQSYNGLGILGRGNDANSSTLYGVPIPKEGINTRTNPIYGRNHVDVRDNVIKQDPNVQRIINQVSNYKASYDPEQIRYLNTLEGNPTTISERDEVLRNQKEWSDNIRRVSNLQKGGTINTTGYLDDTPYVIEQPAMNKIKVKVKGLKANSGITLHDKGSIKPLSNNPYSQSTTDAIVGPTHANDGVLMTINDQLVEAEGGGYNKQGELINTNSDDSVTIFSKKTKIPGTNTSFADEVKSITRQENRLAKQLAKYGKKLDKANAYINQSDPYSPLQAPTYNTGIVNQDAALQNSDPILQELEMLASAKEGLSVLQDMVNKDKDAIKAEKGLRIAQQGDTIPGTNIVPITNQSKKSSYKRPQQDEYYEVAYNAAKKAGIDPSIFTRLVTQESGWNPKAGSNRGAKGIVQFIPETAKQYGIENILNSDKPEDVEKVLYAGAQHFGKLLNQFGGDYNAALLSYNAGPGAKTGDKGYQAMRRWTANRLGKNPEDVTGAEVLDDLRNRRLNTPSGNRHAYHNESLDYVTSIMGYDTEGDYSTSDFNKQVRAISSYGGSPSVPLYTPNATRTAEDMPYAPVAPSTPLPFNITPESVMQQSPTFDQEWLDRATSQQSINNKDAREKTSLADSNKVRLAELLPSILAATQRPDPVPHQSYTPTLYNPYTVSLQDQLNRVNSTYQTASRSAANNPAMQYALASQKYQADSQVLGEQFRTNQQIQNQVTNQNNQLLNQAQTINLQLQGQQIERQAKSVANTRSQRYQALANIANTYSQNRRDNNNIRMLESVSDFRYNPNTGKMGYQGEDQNFNAQVPLLESESGSTIHKKYQRLFRK